VINTLIISIFTRKKTKMSVYAMYTWSVSTI
jgi:hypothetical protein